MQEGTEDPSGERSSQAHQSRNQTGDRHPQFVTEYCLFFRHSATTCQGTCIVLKTKENLLCVPPVIPETPINSDDSTAVNKVWTEVYLRPYLKELQHYDASLQAVLGVKCWLL